jgi:hypothetical protein
MFPGRTNNEMLRMMMAVKGRFPNKLIKAHIRQYEVSVVVVIFVLCLIVVCSGVF